MHLHHLHTHFTAAAAAATLRPSPAKTPFLGSPFRPVPSAAAPPARRAIGGAAAAAAISASLLEGPALLWAGRLCVYYALLQVGLAGSRENPLLSSQGGDGGDDDATGGSDLGFSKWIDRLKGRSGTKEDHNGRKLVSKWRPTTKGTLKRSYRVRSKEEGRRLLKAIAAFLSEDDHFVDASCHKGCQIRRESAHGESVCCYNVRALFDELPTPHLLLEITPFPAGSLTDNDYVKAERLERVLRSFSSI